MNQWNKFKKILKNIKKKPAGHRFVYAHQHFNRYIRQNIPLKIILLLLGIGLIAVGFILLFIPGPGILFIILGSALLCVISKRIAQLLDHSEKKQEKTTNLINKYPIYYTDT